MISCKQPLLSLLAAGLALAVPGAAFAQGDLLVAPTRVVLNGGGGSEVILSNIGAQAATYRISLELKRMSADGNIVDVAEADATPAEQAALAMVRYAPRRITLEPNQPQSVRLSARPAPELPDGEYRVHLAFRAVPDAADAAKAIEQADASGLTIRLTPIYGITIPLIVRKGQLDASVTIANPQVSRQAAATLFKLDLQRGGSRSVYGDVVIQPRGGGKPLFEARGLAVYPELAQRNLALQVSAEQAARLRGPVRIEYREPAEAGGKLIASLDSTLP
ncbi:MAG: molecular chaperone [Novosphingobium sp.]